MGAGKGEGDAEMNSPFTVVKVLGKNLRDIVDSIMLSFTCPEFNAPKFLVLVGAMLFLYILWVVTK